MSSLHDLASDLINGAKLTPQSDKKLYKLEQVKEIIFHRDTSLLPLVIPEMFELMLDRSVAVRRFLVRLAGDALQVTHDITSEALSLFSFLLVDGNDKLLEAIAGVLSRQYDKISITIALMNPKSTALFQQPNSQQQRQPDPKELWYQFRTMCSTLIECVSVQKSDNLRCQCLRICEQMVLFALPQTGGPSQNDPRLRQNSGAKTVQEISMHHAFINRVELEKEAESLLAKMVLWARRGGSQQAPFSPAIQCRLGQTLAVLATERPATLKTIIPALIFLLQGGARKGDVCGQMTAVGRQQLSVGILRLLRIAPKYLSNQGSEHEQLLQLRQAIHVLDDSSIASSESSSGQVNTTQGSTLGGNSVVTLLSGVHSSDPRKRKLEEIAAAAATQAQQRADSLKSVSVSGTTQSNEQNEYGSYEEAVEDFDDDDEMNLDEETIRASAVSAVEAHLSAGSGRGGTRDSKRAKIDDMLDHLTGSTDSPRPSSPSSSSVAGSASPSLSASSISLSTIPPTSANTATAHANITSLASDLVDFPKSSVGNSLRLVSLLPASSGAGSARAPSLLQSIPPPVEVYSDLSLGSLSKLISQTIFTKTNSGNTQETYRSTFSHLSLLSSCLELKLALRMTFSMSARDVDQHRAYLQLLSSKAVGSGSVSRPTIQYVALLKSRGQHDSLLVAPSLAPALSAVPKDIMLPRTLWLMLSHSLLSQERYHALLVEGLGSGASTSSAKHQAAEIIRKANTAGGHSKHGQHLTSGQKFDHIDLIMMLLKELYIRKVANNEGAVVGMSGKVIPLTGSDAAAIEEEEDLGLDLYESLCLVTLSRTLQRRILRPCASRILHQLPRVPVQCVRLLELLLLTGTKPVVSSVAGASGGRGAQGSVVDRGTRIAALEILGSLLFSSTCMNDPAVFFHVLCPLLWLSVHEDFSTRTSAVNCLVGAWKRIGRDFQPGDGLYHVRSTVLLFALQASLHCTGSVNMFSQLVKQKDSYLEQLESRRKSSYSSVDSGPVTDLLEFVNSSTWIMSSGGDGIEPKLDRQLEMEVEVEEQQDYFLDVDEVFASECFDHGALFGGKFAPLPQDSAQQEVFFKRHFHLMSQLCMNKYALLTIFFSIYELTTSFASFSEDKKEKNEDKENMKVGEELFLLASPPLYLQQLRVHVEKEVLSVIPLLLPASRNGFSRKKQPTASSATPIEIITHLIQHCNIKATLPLFCLVLEKVLDPVFMPASEGLLQLGRDLYVQLPAGPINICVLLPLLGGMTTDEVVALLPQVILELSSPAFVPLLTDPTTTSLPLDSAEQSQEEKEDKKEKQRLLKNTFLRKAFHRITHTRPPPLSRAKLLVALHQLDMETHSLKLKHVLDAIGLCIAEKEEYTSDVMKEAILLLLEDTVPAVALMRTVLLSAQTMPEMQKFTLHEVIPRLVRKKTWLIAPKVWEGVLMCVKTFNSQRDFEPTIRAFVGLPMTQLKSVITIAKDVKGILNRILRAMSTADIQECVSGRWAGIEDLNIAQTSKEKEEKEKFIASILSR